MTIQTNRPCPTPRGARHLARNLAMSGLLLALGGCYVVPMNPPAVNAAAPAPGAAPLPMTFTARLYPANEAAQPYGVALAMVTNDLHGHGHFSTTLDGEVFHGEATRQNASVREGIANGSGSRGSFIQCTYRLNNPAQGTGSCRLSNGARFTLHLGS